MVRLSIIIPVYNEEKFLKRCLDSVCGLPDDIQVIVINDGSTDGSQKIFEEYKNEGFFFGNHITNSGVSETRNEGIADAHGDWITFLDSDDCLTPNGIQAMLDVIDEHPDLEVIQMNHLRCQKDGRFILDPRYYSSPGFHDLKNLPPKWALVWNKLYKASFLNEHDIYFPPFQQYDEGRCFNLQCLSHTKGLYCVEQTAVMKHFDNDQSLCHVMNRQKMTEALRELIRLMEYEEDPEMVNLIRESLMMHLNSKRFKNIFKI